MSRIPKETTLPSTVDTRMSAIFSASSSIDRPPAPGSNRIVISKLPSLLVQVPIVSAYTRTHHSQLSSSPASAPKGYCEKSPPCLYSPIDDHSLLGVVASYSAIP